jgi:hypothetical protein
MFFGDSAAIPLNETLYVIENALLAAGYQGRD